jgi:exodeoxyribonuclease VII small subunit
MSSKEQESPTFESSLAQLEELTARLENPETGLEDAIDLFEKGTELAKECLTRLNQAEQRVERLRRTLDETREEPEPTAAPNLPFPTGTDD